MKLSIGYPARASEMEILASHVGPIESGHATQNVLTPNSLASLQEDVAAVTVAEKVQRYLVDLAEATRKPP